MEGSADMISREVISSILLLFNIIMYYWIGRTHGYRKGFLDGAEEVKAAVEKMCKLSQ